MSFAQQLGARPSTPQEIQQARDQGILRGGLAKPRAYTLPSGEVVSNREMQQRAMGGKRIEERAREREAEGFRSPTGVKSNWVRGVQRTESWAKNMSYRQIERDPRFQNHGKGLVNGIYDQWLSIRNKHKGDVDARGIKRSGKYWSDLRFKLLRQYHVLIWDGGGWVSP